MKPTTPPLLWLLLTTPAMAKLDSMSTGADYMRASVSEQENYAYVIATRLNKTRVDMTVDGQDIDGCLRGMLIEFEERQEASPCASDTHEPPRIGGAVCRHGQF